MSEPNHSSIRHLVCCDRSRQIVGNVTRAARRDNANVVNLARSQSHRN